MFKVGDEVSVKGEITKVLESGVVVKAHYFGEAYFDRSNMDVIGKTYEQGLADAWELARKLIAHTDLASMQEMFGSSDEGVIIMSFSVEEALAKIEAYEKEKEIKVGGVVIIDDDVNALVVDEISEESVFVLTENGCIETRTKKYLEKTDKKITISGLLRQIGE